MEIIRTIIVILAAVCSANAFSKYGRTCKDIGCLPSETCTMAEDACSYYQEKNKECGAYPTCKKVASINHSPGPDPASGHNVQPKPYAPPPSSNSGGQNIPGYSPSAPNPDYNPSGGNRGNTIYPSLPSNGNNDPNSNRNNGNNDPYSNRNNGNYDPYPNRGSYDPSPSNNRGGSYPTDPYGNRGTSSGDSGSGSGSGSGSTLNGILNFFRNSGGGGSSSTRYGTPSYSGGSSLSDILNSFGNRGSGSIGNSGGSGLSDIFNSLGNRGSGGSGYNGNNNNYDDRRQQPSPSTGGSSNNGGFISTLTSIFGQQLVNSLIQNTISGNRGGGGNSGGSGLINSLRYGGLLNENNGHSATNDNKPKVTVSGAGPGGYPTQAPYHPPNNSYNNNQPIQSQNYGTNNNAASQNAAQTPRSTQPGQKPVIGWIV